MQTGDGGRGVLSTNYLALYLCFGALCSGGYGRWRLEVPADSDLIIPHDSFINDCLRLLCFQYVAHQYNFCQSPSPDVI